MLRRRVAAIALTLATMLALACGPESQPIEPAPGAQAVKFEEGARIGGNEVNLLVARSVLERTRAQRVADFTKEGTAVAMVYASHQTGKESVLTIAPDFSNPADLVFINKAGKVVKAYATEGHGYVPFGIANEYTGRGNGDNSYTSQAPASVALFVPSGKAEAWGLTEGADAEISPNPASEESIKAADAPGIALYFAPRSSFDREREHQLPAPAKVVARLAIRAEDRARGMLPGEDAVLMLYRKRDSQWMNKGFWLKGKAGEYSVAFMRLTQSAAGPNPMYGSVLNVVEDAKGSKAEAIKQPIWWPSQARISESQGGRNRMPVDISGPINAVLVMRGGKAFSERKPAIIEGMSVVSAPVAVQNPESFAQHGVLIEEDSLQGLSASYAGEGMMVNLVRTQTGRNTLVSDLSARDPQHLNVLAWNSLAEMRVTNTSANPRSIGLIASDDLGTGAHASYTVSEVVTLAPGASSSLEASEPFALLLPSGKSLSKGDAVMLPWQVANLRPNLRRAAFYTADAELAMKTPPTLPEKSKGVWLEIVSSPAAIARGLAYRTSLPKNQGMLFDFGNVDTHEFWMKDCRMDIDVAFVTEDFRIVRIYTMPAPEQGTPNSELELYPSDVPVRWAVEMEGGWFEANGVQQGDSLWLPGPFHPQE